MKIKEFTSSNVRALMAEIENALKPIAEKHGLLLDQKGRTFHRDAVPVMFQLTVPKMDENGTTLDAKAQAFQRDAHLVGLDPDALYRGLLIGGEKYRITGLNLRAKQFPVLAERIHDGKRFKLGVDMVKVGMNNFGKCVTA